MIEIYSDDILKFQDDQLVSVHGISGNGEKITACQCVSAGTGRSFYDETVRAVLRLFPHHVAVGSDYLYPKEREIGCVSYTFPRAVDLFYDPAAAGELHETPELKKLIEERSARWASGREISYSLLFYWADRGPIIDVSHSGIRVRAQSAISYDWPSPYGIHLRNEVQILINFHEPVDFDQTLHSMFEVQLFLNLVMQSEQPIGKFSIIRAPETTDQRETKVYMALDQGRNTDRLDHRDFLISGGLDREELSLVLLNWLGASDDERNARRRFLKGFCQRSNFSVDRFIGAANSFDLLPAKFFPQRSSLPPEVEIFLDETMEKARELTDAGFRNRALSNIGSLKGVNLTDKIVQRFNSLPPALKVHFKDAPLVIRKSVGVRNYFIHGSDPKINPGAVYEFLPFFTKLLEFVFVTSYLTDLGWSAERWIKKFSPSCLLKDLIESFEADVAKLRRELN